jgi:hypothetical protein
VVLTLRWRKDSVKEKPFVHAHICITDQYVEVQTKNGQVYSRIFDAAENENNNMGEVISITTIFFIAKGTE